MPKNVQMQMSPEDRAYLLAEIPKGEWCRKEINPKDPRLQKVILPTLTQMYWLMNQEVMAACEEMGYPLKQWEWKDSAPLTAVAKNFPGIEATDWYQYHLGAVMQKTDHPWVRLITTSPKQPPSSSPSASERPSTPR